MKLSRNYLAIVLILLLAAYLRWARVGLDPMGADDAVISLKAISVARHGQVELLGSAMSVGFWHSPFSIYLYAIPYSLTPDPRIARLFTGALNVIAVALVYLTGKKVFSRPAALIAAVLYAVHPEALISGRGIWNPNVAAPFVALFILTGLLGYYHNNRWARIIHLPALSLAVQCHPSAILLLPITLVLGGHALRQRPDRRREIIGQTMISGAIAALTLLPWGAGLYLAWQSPSAQTVITPLPNRGWGYTFTTIYEGLGYWRKHYSQPIVPVLTAIASLWLLARSFRKEGMPGLAVVMGFFLVPVLALILNAKYRGFYLTPEYPNVFLIQGAFIGGVAARHGSWRGLINTRALRWLVPPLVAFIVGLHLIYAFTPPESYLGPRYSLDEQIAAINLAETRARATGRDLILLAPDTGNEPPYLWELLNEGRDARVVWHGRGLPLPLNGAVMVGFADYAARPFVFSGGDIVGEYFRIVDLPPADHFNPDLAPLQPIRLANGSTLFGFLRETRDSLPSANQQWTIFLIWRVDTPSAEDYKIFVHLINDRGDKYAQLDVPALPVG
ncbi:MAG: glycosyltransferase family 39 protein, partial [Chloroflexota bacterium]